MTKMATLRASAQSTSSEPTLTPVLLTVVIGIGYYMAARMGLLLQIPPEKIAVFWPASGLAAGALLALGPRARIPVAVAVLLATFAANIEDGKPLQVAFIFGLCNALECVVAAMTVQALFGTPFELDSLPRVFGFIAAALLATGVAALPAALTLVHFLDVRVPLTALWHTWLEADAVGIVTLAPFFIALPSALRETLKFQRLAEGVVVLLMIAATTYYVFAEAPIAASWPTLVPLGLLFPLLLWLAARCPPIFAATGSFVVATTIVYCVVHGLGALGQTSMLLEDRVLIAQIAMISMSLCTLALSALIRGQHNIEAALRTSEQRLRLATSAAGLGVHERFIKEDRTVWENDRMYEIFGHTRADGTVSLSDFLNRYIDPLEKDRFIAGYAESLASGEVHRICRIRRKDGQWRDLEIIGVVERDELGEPERVVGVMADVTERRRIEERQTLLIAELDHRVKNALERVATLITSTHPGATSIDGFVDTLVGRIQAMARAHQLLSRGRWSGVEMNELVSDQLAPYAAPERTLIEGPRITLTAEATQALTMVLHELVTNAAKHGALSRPHGKVTVTWRRQSETRATQREQDRLVIHWSEQGGPTVTKPDRVGFGSKVIREPIVYELGGQVEHTFDPGGVTCRIEVAMARVAAG